MVDNIQNLGTALAAALAGDYTQLLRATGRVTVIEAAYALAGEVPGSSAHIRAQAYQLLGTFKDPSTVERIASGLYDYGDEAEKEPCQVTCDFYDGQIVQEAAMNALESIGTPEALLALEQKLERDSAPPPHQQYINRNNVNREVLESAISRLREATNKHNKT